MSEGGKTFIISKRQHFLNNRVDDCFLSRAPPAGAKTLNHVLFLSEKNDKAFRGLCNNTKKMEFLFICLYFFSFKGPKVSTESSNSTSMYMIYFFLERVFKY